MIDWSFQVCLSVKLVRVPFSERIHSILAVWIIELISLDLPKLRNFIAGQRSFSNVKTLVFKSMMLLCDLTLIFLSYRLFIRSSNLSCGHHHWFWIVCSNWVSWLDLPNLTSFLIEDESFMETQTLVLNSSFCSSIFNLIFLFCRFSKLEIHPFQPQLH